jgi:hypothetical protein
MPASTYLYVSLVDIVIASGLAGVVNNAGSRTGGMAFLATQAGHQCVGARGYWAGGATSLKISLWLPTGNVREATVTISVSGPGLWSAFFPTFFNLVPGQAYGITVWDTSGGNYTTYNGLTTGTAPMADILPAGVNGTGPAMIGPSSAVAFYVSNSSDGRYGIYGNGDAAPQLVSTGLWYPVEPLIV